MENADVRLPLELVLPSSSMEFVKANSYFTRRVHTLKLGEETGDWHSVKGGQSASKTARQGNQPEILFNPDAMQWLKIANSNSARNARSISTSASIIQASLRLGGMDDLAEQVQAHAVNIRGQQLPGFVSPHIGPSVEAMISFLDHARTTMPQEEFQQAKAEARRFFGHIYEIAFDQAVRLYLEHGYWTGDPNPGNIVFNTDGEDSAIRVAMIDFGTKTQIRESGYFSYVKQLHLSFKDQALKHSIPFEYDIERYRTECKADRPLRKQDPSLGV